MSDEAGLTLAVDRGASGTILRLGGELDFGTAAPLRDALVDVTQDQPGRVVVDLHEVGFVDSTGISLLVQAKQRVEADGGTFALRGVTDRVWRVLELAGLTEQFAVERARH